jgi:predicted permease
MARRGLAGILGRAVIDSLKRPVVWSPLLGTILVLMSVLVPEAFETMLDQILAQQPPVLGSLRLGSSLPPITLKVSDESL